MADAKVADGRQHFPWSSALAGVLGSFPAFGLFYLAMRIENGPWLFWSAYMVFWIIFASCSPRAAKSAFFGMFAAMAAVAIRFVCWAAHRGTPWD